MNPIKDETSASQKWKIAMIYFARWPKSCQQLTTAFLNNVASNKGSYKNESIVKLSIDMKLSKQDQLMIMQNAILHG